MDHDTSDEDSLMSDKDVDNEPKTLDGFVDSPIYGISKGESMDLVALGNLIWKRSMQFIHMISLSHISVSVMRTKRT